MKQAMTLILVLCSIVQVFAQEGKPLITFIEDSHDFGSVPEENGPISHEFRFINEGGTPLIVSNVKASCGCTTPSWSQEPIAPGDTGMVVAVYNPLNRPGIFSKTISVTTNAEPALAVLKIQGMVQPKPKTPVEDFPTQMGNVRSKYRSLNMGKITTKEPANKFFEIYNDSDSAVIFSSQSVTPPYIQIEVVPQELMPHQKGNIQVTYNAKARNSLGFSSDHIQLFTNEPEDSVKEFSVMATVEEYFPPMTREELEEAPKLSLEKKSYDFGEVNEGASVKTDFKFTNNGKSTLEIREVKANCGCTISKLDKKALAPGETGTVSVTFNSEGRRGKQHKIVTLFTNDPTGPTRQLILTGHVKSAGN